VQKTGSQWIKKVFNDHAVYRKTGLREFTQRRYEFGEFKKNFPKGTFIPGLYISHDLYLEIFKPQRYYTIYVRRDPRDILVSWYFSMLKTHGLMGKVPYYRSQLQKMDVTDGLHFCIEHFAMKFMSMRTWHRDDVGSNVRFIEFLDIAERPQYVLRQIFNDLGFEFAENELLELCARYSKEELRRKDLDARSDRSESHYRKQGSSYLELWNSEHHRHFHNVTGDLIDVLGYTR
jgi:hypothetical protein